jgi:hypothetical protein
LFVPYTSLETTFRSFIPYWKRGVESVAYWFGKEFEKEKEDVVLNVVIPKATHNPGNFQVPEVESTRIGHQMAEMSLVCLAQIHTHPKHIATHSLYDDSHAISGRNGFLSLVVTHYGGVANFDLNQMSVHEAWDHEWVVLEDNAKIERIRIVYDFDARVSDLDE